MAVNEHVEHRRPGSGIIRRVPLLCWLTFVWVLLWGKLDAGTVFFGVLVAALVMVMFPHPRITTNIVVRPLRIVQFALYIASDLVVSTARVAWLSVSSGQRARAGIVAVQMMTDSDHIIAIVANAVSLSPGTFVMQIDRPNRICYVYHLGMNSHTADSVRHDLLKLETRVVHAVGSSSEIEIVDSYNQTEADSGRGKP